MVRSIYVLAYFNNLRKWYAEQGFTFDNWNDTDLILGSDGIVPGRSLRYVPKNQAEHLVDDLVRYALTRTTKAPGEPWLFLGWNASPASALEGTRSHHIERRVPFGDDAPLVTPKGIPEGNTQIKWFRECQWDMSVFMVTNSGNLAEDLEEVYEARIQMKSDIPVDAGSVFILDYPNFRINTQHKTLQTSNPMTDTNNLWALKYDVRLIGPALEFDERQMAAAKKLSITLYDMGKTPAQEITTITKTNS